MAQQTTLEWHDLVIKLGDGASTEVFAAPLALRSRGLESSATTSEAVPMDDTTTSTVMWTLRNVTGLSQTVSGEGLLDPTDYDTWRNWFMGGAKKNIRIEYEIAAASGGGYYQGSFVLTAMSETGDRDANGGLVSISVTMQSAGAVTWTDAS